MSDCVNQHEVRVIGMSRSGNHAILNWIYRQAEGRLCFLNCVEPKTNPFQTARPMDDGRPLWTNDPMLKLSQQTGGKFTPKDWLIYSYEDCFLGMVVHEQFEDHRVQYLGRSKQRTDVLILRDPFNLFASRFCSNYGQVTATTAMRIWKQHAREFCGPPRYLSEDLVTVAFNRWATDRSYRQKIAESLGLAFTDSGFDEVSPIGGGSSFDGRKFSGRAYEMKVLERWKRCSHDRDYMNMIDNEILSLAEKIFDTTVGWRSIMEGFIAKASL